MNRDQINITEPNGVRRSRPIPPQGLTIGRGSENDVVLAYESVSRSHAQITFERGYYHVTDLNSGNGTFVGNVRIPPHVATVWWPSQALRIGGVAITMEPAQPQYRQQADLDVMETQIGWLPEEAQQSNAKNSTQMIWIVVGIILLFLCVCAGLSLGAYYFLEF